MEGSQAIIDKLKLNLHGNVADMLTDKIRTKIISGEIPPGFVFPNETIFCEQLGVSRSTLREAYKALESAGFIRRTKRLGTVVNDFEAISRSAPLGTSLIMSDFEELMEFRVMIEAEIARLAALRASEENIKTMQWLLEKMQDCADSLEDITKYDTMFHMEIAKASGNRLLISTMENAKDIFEEGIYCAFQIDTQVNIVQALLYHTRILDAIIQKDSDCAYILMRQHIQAVAARLS